MGQDADRWMIWSTNLNISHCGWSIFGLFFVLDDISEGLYNFGKTWVSELEQEKEVTTYSKCLGDSYQTFVPRLVNVECGMNRKGKMMPQFFKSVESWCTVFSSSRFPVLSLVHSAFSRRWKTNFQNKSVCVHMDKQTYRVLQGGVFKKKKKIWKLLGWQFCSTCKIKICDWESCFVFQKSTGEPEQTL